MARVCKPLCGGSRRRTPLPSGLASGDLDTAEQAVRNQALGLQPGIALPSKSGILNKCGESIFTGWADRLVVLDAIALRYYDVSYKDSDTLPANSARGLIPLSSQSKVLKLEGHLAPRTRGAGPSHIIVNIAIHCMHKRIDMYMHMYLNICIYVFMYIYT